MLIMPPSREAMKSSIAPSVDSPRRWNDSVIAWKKVSARNTGARSSSTIKSGMQPNMSPPTRGASLPLWSTLTSQSHDLGTANRLDGTTRGHDQIVVEGKVALEHVGADQTVPPNTVATRNA